MSPCKHAIPAGEHDHCREMGVPCTGSFAENLTRQEEMFCYEPVCLWEVYQASGSYEDCCRWLKHRAFCALTCQNCQHMGIEYSANLICYCKNDPGYASCNTVLMKKGGCP